MDLLHVVLTKHDPENMKKKKIKRNYKNKKFKFLHAHRVAQCREALSQPCVTISCV
jgi:hypothetical protein